MKIKKILFLTLTSIFAFSLFSCNNKKASTTIKSATSISSNNTTPTTSNNIKPITNSKPKTSSTNKPITSISTTQSSTTENNLEIGEDIIYDDFQIHFLELGNCYTGDSIFIKAGENDILIDAGSQGNSAETLVNYINKYCKDGKLEYVISTHGHKDHIAGFAGTSKSSAKNYKGEKVGKTGILYYYDVDNLIDFAYHNIEENKVVTTYDNKIQVSSSFKSTTEYGKYLAAREYAISKGTSYNTAKDLWENNNTKITLSSNITMDILYNDYYFKSSEDENNYSVCTMFNYDDHHFLLTGDLELDGEINLTNYYDGSTPEKTLPKVELYKAGHHGSKTSSNECLLNVIKPEICCVCCCAGSSEYTKNLQHEFPTQAFINRIAKFTDRVYVTSLFNEETKTNESFNGNITVSDNGEKIGLDATNNLTKLKDTAWFNADIYVLRTYSTYTWNNAGDYFDVYQNCTVAGTGFMSTEYYNENTANAIKVKRRTWPTY